MTSKGKCPWDGAFLELTGNKLVCPKCGYSIRKADFDKVWAEFDQACSQSRVITRKSVKNLMHKLTVKYAIPK